MNIMDEKERERRLNAFYQGLHAKRWAFMNGTINTPPTDAECEPPPELLPPNKAMEDFIASLPPHPDDKKEDK